MHPEKSRSGFTLLEIMVSVTILALIALLVSRIFSESSRAVSQGKGDALLDEAARELLDYLERDIAQALIRTNVAFRVHDINENDALYLVSTGMRRQLETIRRDTAPMRWQLSGPSSLYPDWNRAVELESPYGSAGPTQSGIGKLIAHSDHYAFERQTTADFEPVYSGGYMSTWRKTYTQAAEESGNASHAMVTFLDFTVNADRSSNRSESDAGPPPTASDLPRFVDVSVGLVASADFGRAMLLEQAGDPLRAAGQIDRHERIYTRRIFLRNQGTGSLEF